MVDFQIIAIRYQGGIAVFPVHQMPVQSGDDMGKCVLHPFHDLGDAEFLFGEFIIFQVDRDSHNLMVSARLWRCKRGNPMADGEAGKEKESGDRNRYMYKYT